MAKQSDGSISNTAADMIHRWIRAKTPAEQAQLPNPSQFAMCNPALKEAWSAWTMLREERKEAIKRGTSLLKADDWWHAGASGAKEEEGVDEEDGEGGMEEEDDGGEEEEDDVSSDDGGDTKEEDGDV